MKSINYWRHDVLIKRLLGFFSIAIFAGLLASCGGGGGGAALAPTLTYQAGVTIGDNGVLEIDRVNLRYSLTIQNSSFSLTGKTFSGAITANADGSYNIVGTTYGRIFIYDNYSVMTLKADPTNPDFAEYFSRNQGITNTVYIPIFALKKESLLNTVDAVTSNGQSLEFRSAFMGSSVSNNTTSYTAEMRLGKITKVSNTVFTVATCSNEGRSDKNSQLANAYAGNCGSGSLVTKTFTYSATEGAWLVTPVDQSFTNQVVRAYFVADTGTNEIIGYIDTADTSKTSAGFAIAAVLPANKAIPVVTSGLSYSIVSYQLCISDANCADSNGENGIYAGDNFVTSASSSDFEDQPRSGGRTCRNTMTDNSPANGISQGVFGPLSPNPNPGGEACNTPGDRPDTISFMFGSQIQGNGKFRSLVVSLGYDPTVTGPSQKISIANLFQN
jgi:hypothetical protein